MVNVLMEDCEGGDLADVIKSWQVLLLSGLLPLIREIFSGDREIAEGRFGLEDPRRAVSSPPSVSLCNRRAAGRTPMPPTSAAAATNTSTAANATAVSTVTATTSTVTLSLSLRPPLPLLPQYGANSVIHLAGDPPRHKAFQYPFLEGPHSQARFA